MKINSYNGWDKLQEIIIGRGEGRANLVFPKSSPVSEQTMEKAQELAREAFPQWLTDEINEDLEGLCDVCRSAGAKVFRPDVSHNNLIFETPYVRASGDHVYNMRDLHLVVGNTVIESPSQEQHRYFEAMGLYHIWYEYLKEGFRWICGPKPRLTGDYMISYFVDGTDEYPDGQKFIKLTEDEILFEAANTLRMGKDLLYLVSRSGNELGAKWLQHLLGDEYRVHTTDKLYRSSHIDSTALALRPGLVLLNETRVNESNCPEFLNKWEKVYFKDIVATPERTIKFHQDVRKRVYRELKAMNVDSGLDAIASPWIGMNFLSLDPSTVVVDKIQVPLIRVLEKQGLTVVPISFRHSYYMGGIHCSSLDTVRDGGLEDYFA